MKKNLRIRVNWWWVLRRGLRLARSQFFLCLVILVLAYLLLQMQLKQVGL